MNVKCKNYQKLEENRLEKVMIKLWLSGVDKLWLRKHIIFESEIIDEIVFKNSMKYLCCRKIFFRQDKEYFEILYLKGAFVIVEEADLVIYIIKRAYIEGKDLYFRISMREEFYIIEEYEIVSVDEFIKAKAAYLENSKLKAEQPAPRGNYIELYCRVYFRASARKRYLRLAFDAKTEVNEVKYDESYYYSIFACIEMKSYYTETIIFCRKIEDRIRGDVFEKYWQSGKKYIIWKGSLNKRQLKELFRDLRKANLVARYWDGDYIYQNFDEI